jgi:thiol:disulfide interchange protein
MADGIQQVLNPERFIHPGDGDKLSMVLLGKTIEIGKLPDQRKVPEEWFALVPVELIHPVFKPADIRALAQMLNEHSDSVDDSTQMEELRASAELDRSAMESAWRLAEQAQASQAETAAKLSKAQSELDAYRIAHKEYQDEIAELRSTLVAQKSVLELSIQATENEKLDAEHWWKLCERERECRERVQEEARTLEKKLEQTNEQPSRLLAVAGLLELLVNETRYQQGTAAQMIEAKGWYGASASKLTKLFAEAKAAAREADKIVQAKVEEREFASRAKAKKPTKI